MPNANTNGRTFSASIRFASRDLSVEEKIKLKDTRDAISLEESSREGAVVVKVVGYVVLDIHNEKSEDKDYVQYLLIGANGDKYLTGSESFFNSFIDIWEELEELPMPNEGWGIKVYQRPSKNYQGRNFVTCSLA